MLDCDDTKTGTAWESPVPEILAVPLRRYIAEARPELLARGEQSSDALWVNDQGSGYATGHFSDRIKGLTRRLVGTDSSPHLFRDCAATTLACEPPEAARLTRAILGHAGFATATRHYNHARMIASGRDFAGLIDDLRAEAE